MVMATLSANDQYRRGQRFVCTGNNVNVRTGLGKNYGVATISNCMACNGRQRSYSICNGRAGRTKFQLMKGDGYDPDWYQITYKGKSKNGSLYVDIYEDHEGTGGTGWVSAQYLRPI